MQNSETERERVALCISSGTGTTKADEGIRILTRPTRRPAADRTAALDHRLCSRQPTICPTDGNEACRRPADQEGKVAAGMLMDLVISVVLHISQRSAFSRPAGGSVGLSLPPPLP